MQSRSDVLRTPMRVRMVQTDKVTAITPGDFFEIPPGHDAYVEGSDRVELILFGAPA